MKTIEEIVRKAHDSLLSSPVPNEYSFFFQISGLGFMLKKKFERIGYFDTREKLSEMGSIATLAKNENKFVMRFFIYENRFGAECNNENKVHSLDLKNQLIKNSEKEQILFYKFILLHEFKHFMQLLSGDLTFETIASSENQSVHYQDRNYEKEANDFASNVLREELLAYPTVPKKLKVNM